MTQTTPTHSWACNTHGTQPATARPDWDKGFPTRNGHRAGREDCFLNPLMHRRTPKANQGFSKAKHRDCHAVCTLWVHSSTSPIPPWSPHHKMKVSCQIYPATSGKGLTLHHPFSDFLLVHAGRRLSFWDYETQLAITQGSESLQRT